jgi:excisionase family DNA binding protein
MSNKPQTSIIECALGYPPRDLAADFNPLGRGRDHSRRRRKRKAAFAGPRLLLTTAEAADRLGITVEKLLAFVHDGQLRGINMGRGSKRPRYKFTEADISELIEKRKTQEVPCPSTNPKSPRRISGLTSKSVVVGFMDRRAAQIAAKRKR